MAVLNLAGRGVFQAVWHCRWWTSAPSAARLVFFLNPIHFLSKVSAVVVCLDFIVSFGMVSTVTAYYGIFLQEIERISYQILRIISIPDKEKGKVKEHKMRKGWGAANMCYVLDQVPTQSIHILAQAYGVPVGQRLGGRLAMRLVATKNNIIFSLFSFSPSSTFLIEGALGSTNLFR